MVALTIDPAHATTTALIIELIAVMESGWTPDWIKPSHALQLSGIYHGKFDLFSFMV